MTITFKRFHASARLSEETVAYDTDVLFDGKPIGSCRNEGRGGQGFFRAKADADPAVLEQAQAWACQQPYLEEDGSTATMDGKPLIVQSIDEYCDLLAERTLADKQEMAQVKRMLKKRAVFSDPARGGDIFSLQGVYTGERMKAAIEQRYPGAIVLNAIPIEQAIELFREQNRRARQQAATGGRKPKP